MLNARLFAGLAGLAFVIAILVRRKVSARKHVYLRIAKRAFGPFYTHLFIALVCAIFGFAYFGVVHLTQRPINQTTGFVGFILVGVASVVWLISSSLATTNSLRNPWLVKVLFASILGFISGMALTAANLAWVLVRK